MADNVDITPGAGITIATDDISDIHYQRVKLVSGELGADEPIGSDDLGGAHSIWQTPRRRYFNQVVASSGETIATTAYTSGDVFGTGWEFPNFTREAGGCSIIRSIQVIDVDDRMGAYDLALFGEAVTMGTDNAVLAISDADIVKCQYWFATMIAPLDVGGARIGSIPAQTNQNPSLLGIPIVTVGTSLFAYMVVRAADAAAGSAGGRKLSITYEQM